MKCLQCLTEVTSTRQNENESRTRGSYSRDRGRRRRRRSWAARACEGRAQGMRLACSCRSALASRLWQPGLAQEVIFRMKWRMQAGWGEGKRGASVTEWTPGTSPGCRRGGCCCWSRCRSSGGWSSWLPPAAASACSSVETAEGGHVCQCAGKPPPQNS